MEKLKTEHRVAKTTVKAMLGGKWPEIEGYESFCYGAVDHYRLEDGLLIPYDGETPCPGPSFRLVPIPDPFASGKDPAPEVTRKPPIPKNWLQLRETVRAVVQMLDNEHRMDPHGIYKRARDLLQLELDNTADEKDVEKPPAKILPNDMWDHDEMAVMMHKDSSLSDDEEPLIVLATEMPVEEEDVLPSHLKDTEEPAAICTLCGRKTWSSNLIGSRCNMLQPNDKPCPGLMGSPMPKGEFCSTCNRNPCVCSTFGLR